MNLALPVALLHVAAFSMGYFLCKGLGFNEKTSRTVSIETGALQMPLAQLPYTSPPSSHQNVPPSKTAFS